MTKEFAEKYPLFAAMLAGVLLSLLTVSSPLVGMQVLWLPKKDPTLAMISAYILNLTLAMAAPRLILLRKWSYKEFRQLFLANLLAVVFAIPVAFLLVVSVVIIIGLVGYGLQFDLVALIEQTNLFVLLLTSSYSAVVWFMHGKVLNRLFPQERNIKREWVTMYAVAAAVFVSLGIYVLDMMLIPESTGFPSGFDHLPSAVAFNSTVFLQVAVPLSASLVCTIYTNSWDLSPRMASKNL